MRCKWKKERHDFVNAAVMVTKVSVVFRFCSLPLLSPALLSVLVVHHVENPKSFVNFHKITMLWWCNILLTYCPAGISPLPSSRIVAIKQEPQNRAILKVYFTIHENITMMTPFWIYILNYTWNNRRLCKERRGNMTGRYLL